MTTATSSCRAPEGRRTQFASALLASATDPCVARAQICSSVAYLKKTVAADQKPCAVEFSVEHDGECLARAEQRSSSLPRGQVGHLARGRDEPRTRVADGGPGDTAAAHASNGSSRLPTRSAPRQLIIECAECLEPVRRRGKLRQLGNQPHEPLGSHRSATRVARSVCERQEVALCRRHSEGAIRSETRGLEYCDGCFHVS